MTRPRHIEEHTAQWRGVTLRITWEPHWLITQSTTIRSAHLTIQSVSPAAAPLPITETGFLSWFVFPEQVAEASSRAWLQAEAARRQLSLFD